MCVIYICTFLSFWLLFVFSFSIRTDLMLWKLKTYDLTMSNFCVASSVSSLSCCTSWAALHPLSYLGVCLLWPLQNFSKWLTLSHFEHLLPYAGHLLGLCRFPQYLPFSRVSLLVGFTLSNVLFICSHFHSVKLYYLL